MKKRGAIHVDWVISIGIFLVYVIVLLVLIKPSYKAGFEGDVLTEMIRDEFLEQNKVNAGFVAYKAEGCEGVYVSEISEKLPNIALEDVYIELVDSGKKVYNAYFFEGRDLSSDDYEFVSCEEAEIGEVFYYNGLRQNLNFDPGNVDENGVKFEDRFPSSRKYKIDVYEDGEKDEEIISLGEPSGDDTVYVLDWSGSRLGWNTENNELTRGNVIIINIQVW